MTDSKSARRVSTFWSGRDLGTLERICLLSFVNKDYVVDVYSYNRNLSVPKGVRLLDANDILDSSRLFENFQQKGTYAAFSNIFRYSLLHKQETTWVDTDLMLLANDLPETEYLFAYESAGRINGALLRAPSESPFLKSLIQKADEIDPERIKWGDLGPNLISRTVRSHGLSAHALRDSQIYPIPPNELWKLFDPECFLEIQERLRGAITLHMWNEYFRRSLYFAINASPPSGSYWHHILRSFGDVPEYATSIPINLIRKSWRRELNPSSNFLGRRINSILFRMQTMSLSRRWR